MNQSFTPREFIDKINADNPGQVFDPYGVEGLIIKQQEEDSGVEMLTQAKAEVAKEKAKKTPEEQIAELERQVEAMKNWLIQDGTYTPEEVDNKIQPLKVEYNEFTQHAEVVGVLDLRSLTSAEGLELPDSIGGFLDLRSLTSAEGLELPDSIGGDLYLGSLTTAEHLELPDRIGGNLTLRSLTSAEHLQLPTSIGRDIYLDGLTSAEHLQLPDSIDGDLGLDGLTSAEHLTLPTSIGGDLYLGSLTTAEREHLRAQRPDLAENIEPIP
jgi:hypothetical protein